MKFSCFVKESFLHSQTRFLDVHDDYYMATIYIHYVFFLSFQFNSRKTNKRREKLDLLKPSTKLKP